jgi:excisionase family DNA binding protein
VAIGSRDGIDALSIELTADLIEAVAQRAAELVLARSEGQGGSPFLTTREAAEYLRCAPQRIHELVCRGELSRFKEGGRLLLDRREVDALVVADRRRRRESC